MSDSSIYLGLDVHKESITVAVLPGDAPTPTRVDRLPHDLPQLQRYLSRLAREGTLRLCYAASCSGRGSTGAARHLAWLRALAGPGSRWKRNTSSHGPLLSVRYNYLPN